MIMQRAMTVEEICRKLKPVFGKKIDDIYLRYAMASTLEEKNEIESILNALYHKNLHRLLDKSVLLEPPRPEDVEGDYGLAFVKYADKTLYPFKLREQDWPRHVCISGMSGSGKTTLAFHVIGNFIRKDKPFLIFDWKKSFRPLTLADKEIMLFTIGNDSVSNLFRLNINEPPKGVNPKEWINVLCDLLTETFFASFGVHKILLETLDEAYREWGIYSGSKNYPTWNHIKWRLEQKLDKAGGREAGWLESALRIATVLTFGDFGETLNYKGENEIDMEDLLKRKVIFELNSLGNIEKKFFCEFVLAYIYKLRKASQKAVSNQFEHAILVDEAHNIFLKDRTHFVNESVTDMIYREMREYGTSLICLDQHLSKLSDTVKGNSACHIAFQQQLPQDIADISELMQMKDSKEVFTQLPVGSAIVKLSERYTTPFLVEVPNVELRKQEVNDSEIKARMEAIMAGKLVEQNPETGFNQAVISGSEYKGTEEAVEPEIVEEKSIEVYDNGFTNIQNVLYNVIKEKLRDGFSLSEVEKAMTRSAKLGKNYRISDVIKVVNKIFDEQFRESLSIVTTQKGNIYKPENAPEVSDGLTPEQDRFITFLQENPAHNLATVEVYKQVGLSSRKGNKIKDELMDMGLIKVEEIKYDKGWKKIIQLA